MQQVYRLEQEQKEKEENEKAAAEAAKDLDIDYGESDSQKSGEDVGNEASAEKLTSKHSSVVNLLRNKGIHSLASTGSGLDSLIGAGSILEMSDGDTDFLKSYSEKVAAEADESDES